jgi:hypothetical protein
VQGVELVEVHEAGVALLPVLVDRDLGEARDAGGSDVADVDEVAPVPQGVVELRGAGADPHDQQAQGRPIGEDALARPRVAPERMGRGDVGRHVRRDEAVGGLDHHERAAVAHTHRQVGASRHAVRPPGDAFGARNTHELAGPLGARLGCRIAELQVEHRGAPVLHG